MIVKLDDKSLRLTAYESIHTNSDNIVDGWFYTYTAYATTPKELKVYDLKGYNMGVRDTLKFLSQEDILLEKILKMVRDIIRRFSIF